MTIANVAERLITQLEAEIVKRDALIADLEAQLEDTESRRDNAARNSSAFEDRMGALQVENGKLQARIAELEASYQHGTPLHKAVFMALESYTGSDSFDDGVRGLISELAALKAQQPSAGVVDERAAFEAVYVAEFQKVRNPRFTVEMLESMRTGESYGDRPYLNGQWVGWQARASLNSTSAGSGAVDDGETRHDAVKALHDVMEAVPCSSLYSMAEAVLDAGYSLNPCRAQAVPDVLFDGFAVYSVLDAKAQGRTSPENVSDTLDAAVRLIRAATPSAQQKESGDE